MDWMKISAGVVAGAIVCEICGSLFTHEYEHRPHVEPRDSSDNKPFTSRLTFTVAASGSNFSISEFPEAVYFTKKK